MVVTAERRPGGRVEDDGRPEGYFVHSWRGRTVAAMPRHDRSVRMELALARDSATWRLRAVRRSLWTMAATGVDQRLARGDRDPDLGHGWTVSSLLDALADEGIEADAAGIGWPKHTHRGRVYLYLVREGEVPLFVKVTLGQRDPLLEGEGRTLARWAEREPRTFVVPEVVATRQADDLSFVATVALEPGGTKRGPVFADQVVRAAEEIASSEPARTVHRADDLGWWERYRSVVATDHPHVGRLLDAAFERGVRVAPAHGDLAPQNLGFLDGRLCVVDWEYATPDAPRGLDRLTHDLLTRSSWSTARARRRSALRFLRHWSQLPVEGRDEALLGIVFRRSLSAVEAAAIMDVWEMS